MFELPLPAQVRGINYFEEEFQETTRLLSMSSQSATLLLKNRVTIGSRLSVCLKIPQTLFLGKSFRLLVTGEVTFARGDGDMNNEQTVSIKLDRNYSFKSTNSKPL